MGSVGIAHGCIYLAIYVGHLLHGCHADSTTALLEETMHHVPTQSTY